MASRILTLLTSLMHILLYPFWPRCCVAVVSIVHLHSLYDACMAGLKRDVVLGGRKTNFTLLRTACGWAEQLSTNSKIGRFSQPWIWRAKLCRTDPFHRRQMCPSSHSPHIEIAIGETSRQLHWHPHQRLHQTSTTSVRCV